MGFGMETRAQEPQEPQEPQETRYDGMGIGLSAVSMGWVLLGAAASVSGRLSMRACDGYLISFAFPLLV